MSYGQLHVQKPEFGNSLSAQQWPPYTNSLATNATDCSLILSLIDNSKATTVVAYLCMWLVHTLYKLMCGLINTDYSCKVAM